MLWVITLTALSLAVTGLLIGGCGSARRALPTHVFSTGSGSVTGRWTFMAPFEGGPSNELKTQPSLLPIERDLLALLCSRAKAHKL